MTTRDLDAERSYWLQEAAELRRRLATGTLDAEETAEYRRYLDKAETHAYRAFLLACSAGE